MKKGVRRKKISAIVIDLFVFAQLVQLFLKGAEATGLSLQWLFLLAVLVSGSVTYVAVPWAFRGQTLGMKLSKVRYGEVADNKLQVRLILRFLFNLVSNLLLLGIPIAVNVFLLLWNVKGFTLADYVFKDMQLDVI